MIKKLHFQQTGLASLAIAMVCAAAPAIAQQAPAAPTSTAAAEEDMSEMILVTGSRIAQPALASPSPLQIIDANAIRSTGAANLQEVLLQSPLFGTPTVSRTNSNFSTSGAGLATVDLRNLGTARTLVLVNGRRHVSGSPNDQAVDLNSIPTAFVERVDVLTGGASSVYGSDAVAGVVNFVYKTRFEGIEANAQTGLSELGDDLRYQGNLTIGANTADGRGNVMAHIGYSKDGAVFSRNRAASNVDQASTGAFVTGDAADLFSVTRPFFSSFAPQGRFFSAPGVTAGTFNSNGQFITGFSTNGSATRAADGYNRSQFRTIALPVERLLLAARANYEVTNAIEVFLEGTFAKTSAITELEPFAVSTAGTNGIFQGTGGFYPVEQRLANGTVFVNPLVPAGLLATLGDVDGDGLRDVSFTRRLSDIDNRGSTADRTTYRLVAGLQGDVFGTWRWDVAYNYGRTDDNQNGTGQINLANFRNALVVTRDAGGNLVCADVNARAQGCVPANVYGANTLSSAAAQYVRADSNRTSFAEQSVFTANLSGDLLANPLGAGPLGVAIGGEQRRERSASAFDALQQAGLNGGNAIPNTSGSFNVSEAYIEGRLPLLADRPFFDELALRGAFRVSDYSTVGTAYSWNYGAEWSPVKGIRLRGMFARATRAPNVSELFQGLSQTFPTGINDPCTGVTAATAGLLGVTCRSFPGVNANIAANGLFTRTQADQQGISGFDGGNPLLSEEVADTLTAGVVIAPQWDFARGFNLTVDYSRTRIKGAVVSTPRQFILDQCFAQGQQQFCQFVTRRPAAEGANSPGSLNFINSGATNSGGVFNSNLDVAANYTRDVGFGRIALGVAYTHVFAFYQVPVPGSDPDYIDGEVGAAKNRFLATAGVTVGKVNFQYRGTYVGPSYLDDQFLAAFDVPRNGAQGRIGSRYYSDLQVQFDATDNFQFYVGANNLTNTKAPSIPSGLPGNVTGAETDSGTYDAIGRRFYAGVRLRM